MFFKGECNFRVSVLSILRLVVAILINKILTLYSDLSMVLFNTVWVQSQQKSPIRGVCLLSFLFGHIRVSVVHRN